MNVRFLDLRRRYAGLRAELEAAFASVVDDGRYVGAAASGTERAP